MGLRLLNLRSFILIHLIVKLISTDITYYQAIWYKTFIDATSTHVLGSKYFKTLQELNNFEVPANLFYIKRSNTEIIDQTVPSTGPLNQVNPLVHVNLIIPSITGTIPRYYLLYHHSSYNENTDIVEFHLYNFRNLNEVMVLYNRLRQNIFNVLTIYSPNGRIIPNNNSIEIDQYGDTYHNYYHIPEKDHPIGICTIIPERVNIDIRLMKIINKDFTNLMSYASNQVVGSLFELFKKKDMSNFYFIMKDFRRKFQINQCDSFIDKCIDGFQRYKISYYNSFKDSAVSGIKYQLQDTTSDNLLSTYLSSTYESNINPRNEYELCLEGDFNENDITNIFVVIKFNQTNCLS